MFTYDPFQKRALFFIDKEQSLLISAPTGAGKTCIAEYAIEQAMAHAKGAVYTAPIKALSNQKYRDFRARYGNNVGIITGDVIMNAHAPLLIMTTEIYRNRLFDNTSSLDHIEWVIFDEIHYLDDIERGTVWEEAIMFSPPHVKFICLSATVPNITELAGWMNEVHNRNIQVIVENNRPVPLHHTFQAQGKVINSFKRLFNDGFSRVSDWSHISRPRRPQRKKKGKRFAPQQRFKVRPNRIDALIKHIESHDQLPCIFFTFARRRTEYLAEECSSFQFLMPKERTRILDLFDSLCDQYEISDEPYIPFLYDLIGRGIAYHHAGMLPSMKEIVERLFTSRLIKLIFTTETFALGINMPAKTVVFDELRKYHGTHFGPLRTRDYYQMAGRAGRRGMDSEGYVYARINPRYIRYNEVESIIKGDPEPVMSQFNATYATLLNVYAHYQEKLLDIYPESFHFYQSSQRLRKRALSLLKRKLELLKFAEYIEDRALTTKGTFASLMYGYELLLAEMFEEGFLDHLSERDLVIVLLALVFEPRKADEAPRFSKNDQKLIASVEAYYTHVRYLERQFRVDALTKAPFFHLLPIAVRWVDGAYFQDIVEDTTSDEGEIVRYFRMVIQLLRVIRSAPTVSKVLKQTCIQAIHRINRDEIDAEKQLRV